MNDPRPVDPAESLAREINSPTPHADAFAERQLAGAIRSLRESGWKPGDIDKVVDEALAEYDREHAEPVR